MYLSFADKVSVLMPWTMAVRWQNLGFKTENWKQNLIRLSSTVISLFAYSEAVFAWNDLFLMPSMLGKISVNGFIVIFFSNFPLEIQFVISCRLSPEEKICVICQTVFSVRNRKLSICQQLNLHREWLWLNSCYLRRSFKEKKFS